MTEDERFAWLQLAFTPYIGAESFLLLLHHFGSAQNALSAPAEQVAALIRHKQALEAWRNAENAPWRGRRQKRRWNGKCGTDAV